MSDVDTVWMKNPLPYMAKYPQADCLTSSDHIVRWPPPLPPFSCLPLQARRKRMLAGPNQHTGSRNSDGVDHGSVRGEQGGGAAGV